MNTPTRTTGWTWARRLMLAAATLITLLTLFWTGENWRGKRAWLQFKRQWEARGEKFDLAALRPPAVTPQENFALTPVLAPLLDYQYEKDKRGVVWRDTNAPMNWNIRVTGGPKQDNPPFGNLVAGTYTDLKAWQDYYRRNQNFSLPATVQTPAEAVLSALAKFEGPLQELAAAAKRPHAIFPVHYEEGVYAMMPHLNAIRSYATIYRLRSLASLHGGATESARNDMRMCFYLGQSLRHELTLVSHLVRLAILQDALNGLWEGLALRRWTREELRSLQDYVGTIDVLKDYGRVLRGDRALLNQTLDQYRQGLFRLSELGDLGRAGDENVPTHWLDRMTKVLLEAMSFERGLRMPSGWVYQNQLLINKFYQERALGVINAEAHRVLPQPARELDNFRAELGQVTPYNRLAHILMPALSSVSQKFALTQILLDQATVACALEGYYARHRAYPEALASLVPDYLAQVPLDVIDGKPLRYGRRDDSYLLYSIGWNERDDGGKVAPRKRKNQSIDRAARHTSEGDWVWSHSPVNATP